MNFHQGEKADDGIITVTTRSSEQVSAQTNGCDACNIQILLRSPARHDSSLKSWSIPYSGKSRATTRSLLQGKHVACGRQCTILERQDIGEVCADLAGTHRNISII